MTGSRQSVAVIGGAIMGSFCAYFLKRHGFPGRVLVFERDATYQKSSTALCAGAIRTQFGCDFNARMSLFGAELFRNITDWFGPSADIGFEERGYLILHTHGDGSEIVTQQEALGCDVSALNKSDLLQRFPWINTDGVACGTFGNRNEGWYDAWSLLGLVRNAAKSLGVEYVAADVSQICADESRVTGVVLADSSFVSADFVVNAAGPLSAKVLEGLAIRLPVVPKKRTVFNVETPLANETFPMLFDTSGVWIRPEGNAFIAGIAPDHSGDPDAEGDFEPDYYLFDEKLWPRLAERVPAMESLRMTGAWAGHYEINLLDHNGVVGPHDELSNLMFATGFSGHGLMHAPAVGRGISELICAGGFETLDLSPLEYSRITSNSPVKEFVTY